MPALVALTARNYCAQGGRLTAGCYRFSLPGSTIVAGRHPYRAGRPKSVAAGAIAPRRLPTSNASASADRLRATLRDNSERMGSVQAANLPLGRTPLKPVSG